jgi:hypothetical protein
MAAGFWLAQRLPELPGRALRCPCNGIPAEDRLMCSASYETALMYLGVIAAAVFLCLLVVFGAEWIGLVWRNTDKKEPK